MNHSVIHGLAPNLPEQIRAAAGRAREALAAEGIAMAIEFVAGFGLGTLAGALALAEAAGDDVGLVIDVWPLVRTGGTAADVARLPPGRFAFLQLSDVAAVATGDLATENNDGRLLPGEGLAAAPLVCAAAQRVGFDGHLSLEVLNASWRARPVADLATAGLAAVRAAWGGADRTDLT